METTNLRITNSELKILIYIYDKWGCKRDWNLNEVASLLGFSKLTGLYRKTLRDMELIGVIEKTKIELNVSSGHNIGYYKLNEDKFFTMLKNNEMFATCYLCVLKFIKTYGLMTHDIYNENELRTILKKYLNEDIKENKNVS
jgi:hypothetical protein